MGIYDLGGITIKTDCSVIHKDNLITLSPLGKGVVLKLKYNSKNNELIFWQPTGFFGLGKSLGIQIKKLIKGKAVAYGYEGAAEYKKDGQRVFAKTRVFWKIVSSDSVNFVIKIG